MRIPRALLTLAGKHYQMHCASEGSCDKGDLGHMKSMSVCNRTDCWSTKYADYLSMDLVLRAANMSLDAQLPMPSEANLKSASDLPRRFLGASLAIDIRYENVAACSALAIATPMVSIQELLHLHFSQDGRLCLGNRYFGCF